MSGSETHGGRPIPYPGADELLILVDEEDNIVAHETKNKCHEGEGLLHRAFSIFIFNDSNQLFIQQRSTEKKLWPLYWSNSVCSHPRKGEKDADAARRRLGEELGLSTGLRYLFKFRYQAGFRNVSSENELCSVYIGRNNGTVRANPNEIQKWKYIELDALDREFSIRPECFTPWFRIEWERMRREHLNDILTI